MKNKAQRKQFLKQISKKNCSVWDACFKPNFENKKKKSGRLEKRLLNNEK